MTDNEPTVRYWRLNDAPHDVITRPAQFEVNGTHRTEVVVMTPTELAAHTTAARADAWGEGYASGKTDGYFDGGYPCATNPYTESKD